MPLSRPLFERRHVLASSILGSFGLFVPSAAYAASTAPPGPAPAITEAGTTVEGPARTTDSFIGTATKPDTRGDPAIRHARGGCGYHGSPRAADRRLGSG